MVKREEVALKANVSPMTVTRVVSGKGYVAEETRKKVMQVVKELNYVTNQIARSLVSRRNNCIGVALYEATNPYHIEIIQSIEKYVCKFGYIVSIFLLNNNFEKKLNNISGQKMSGLLNFATNDYPQDFLEQVVTKSTVLVNFKKENSIIIENDYKQPMLEYMKTLKELGHTRVGYLWSTDKLRFEEDTRGKVFLENRERFGFDTDENLIVYCNDYTSKSEVVGYKGCEMLLARRRDVSAIFATNDLLAIGAMRCLHEHKILVPNDVSIIGCDDIGIGNTLVPRLSTITFNKDEYGEVIGKAIIDQIESGEKKLFTITIPSQIKIGESLAKFNGGK